MTLCNRYGVLLYVSDLNSGDKGAALSFGVKEYEYGSVGAELALSILEKGQNPERTPVVFVPDIRVKVNRSTMKKQGLDLSEEKLEEIKRHGGIVS